MEKRAILEAGVARDEVSEVYRKIAPTYDLWGRLTESKARDRCLEVAAIRDGEAVLEVAVGTGLAFERVLRANPNGRNEGIDCTEAMLDRAKTKAERTGLTNYRLRIGDAYDLDYPDASFDVLINNYMFDLIPETDFAVVLGEFARVLRPGGRLVMINMAQGERWYHGIWELVYRVKPSMLGGCRGVHLAPYLESAGFDILSGEFVSQMTFPSEVVCAVKPGDA